MFRTREQLEDQELSILAPYAASARGSLGRKLPEKQHAYRTCFQRDRARVIHCAAFRRLDGKTQVFLNGTGDHYRTRLTHTIEVASVSRTVARALGLNEDLAEAIALAHDLGHPPFGHAGEEKLDELMRGVGGFDHNEQSLRVVEWLEDKYPRHPGLNLSFEVIEGMQKHADSFPPLPGDSRPYHSATLESQIADVADEIAYYSHDLDDGLASGLLDAEALAGVAIWAEAAETAKCRASDGEKRGHIIRCLTNCFVEDLVHHSASTIETSGITDLWSVRQRKRNLIGFSSVIQSAARELRRFLYRNLYHHRAVAGVHERSCLKLEAVFRHLREHPSLLGRKAQRRIARDGLDRVVADYVSGMTDRYLATEYETIEG